MRNVFVFIFAALLLSCEALPVNYSTGESWFIGKNAPERDMPALTLLGVQVDRSGGWDSVEKETAALAPLYFWDRGFVVVSAEEKPDYAALIQVREREFTSGWRTKKSLAVEVRIWAYEDAPQEGTPFYEQKLPLAAGRVVAMGEKSFSSSETTGRLLSRAIGKTAEKIIAYERRKENA